MGYILPITHYTYNDYHRRIIKENRRPHYIDAPHRVNFYKINREFDDEKTFNDILKEKERELLYISAGEKAALTGKGNMINKKI